jgi:hypothetical protein
LKVIPGSLTKLGAAILAARILTANALLAGPRPMKNVNCPLNQRRVEMGDLPDDNFEELVEAKATQLFKVDFPDREWGMTLGRRSAATFAQKKIYRDRAETILIDIDHAE